MHSVHRCPSGMHLLLSEHHVHPAVVHGEDVVKSVHTTQVSSFGIHSSVSVHHLQFASTQSSTDTRRVQFVHVSVLLMH